MAILANKKWNGHEEEMSNQRGGTTADYTPANSSKASPVATVEDEAGACDEEKVRMSGGKRKKLVRMREASEVRDESAMGSCESRRE